MAGEQRLRDAKIKVRLDTSEALRQLGDLGKGRDGASVPGGKPPAPGREDERKKREDEERRRDERRENRRSRTAGAAAAAGAVPRAVIGAAKTIASAAALSLVAETVPAMIDARLETLGNQDPIKRQVVSLIRDAIGIPLEKIGDVIRTIESALPVIAAFTGTSIDVARANAILGGGATSADILALATRQSRVRSAETSLQLERRRLGRGGAGQAVLQAADQLRADLLGAASTAK